MHIHLMYVYEVLQARLEMWLDMLDLCSQITSQSTRSFLYIPRWMYDCLLNTMCAILGIEVCNCSEVAGGMFATTIRVPTRVIFGLARDVAVF